MMADSRKRSAFDFSWVLGKRRRLETNPSLQASSSSSAPNSLASDLPKICKLNQSVYELHKPEGTPSMQVLFFHGLQFQDYTNAHLSTWTSGDGSQFWPQTWLVDEFPGAHVLSVSYDARVVKGDGNLDLYLIAENLTSDLLSANIGQEPSCPVILVGHCFGGLVIKRLCLQARRTVDLKGASSEIGAKLIKFLQNVQGVFYYGTPHRGIPDPLKIAKYFVPEGPLLRFVEILSTDAARLNSEFDDLRHGCYKNAWRIAGVGERLPTRWGWFGSDVVVPEASARDGEIFNVVEDADHISICKPNGKKSRSFYALTNLLGAIVQDLKVKLPVHECLEGLPDYPVELEERTREIAQKLRIAPVLGIVGMGGVGKTTLVKAVFNHISKDFEYTCFVDNSKGISKHALKDTVLSQFYCNGSRVDGPKTEWLHLKDKKMLLVLDDIDSEEQLSFLPKLDRFGNGSRVIITTRDQRVLKVFHHYVRHEVAFLKEDAATQLFCKHAFRQEGIPSSFTEKRLIRNVIVKCDGLPLTLEVMGRYLRDHENDAEFWKETIGRLGRAQAIHGDRNDRVWASLRVSYDALIKEEQEMFTSAATYFFGRPLEWALAAWSTTCGNSKIGWENLVSRCLVKEVHRSKYNSSFDKVIEYKAIWVHEHLRDLAGTILAPSNSMDAFNGKTVLELVARLNASQVAGDLKTEYLSLREYFPSSLKDSLKDKRRKKQRTLLCGSLLNMKQLKYMTLHSVLVDGFPKKFPRNLSLLSWDGTLEEGLEFPISCIEDMENLAILQLQNWQTSQTFPVALGKLSNLRILCLEEMKGVDLLPEDLGQLSGLKQMELSLAHLAVLKLPESFGGLSSLKTLTFGNVELSKLPESFSRLSSLEALSFSNIPLLELPESFGSLSSLKELVFKNVQLLELPESFGSLTSLKLLFFRTVPLSKLPESFVKLSSLVVLRIDKCGNLVSLPENFGLLYSLEELELGSTQGTLESLPDTFGPLRALKKLTMYQEKLQSLPYSFCDMRSLQELEISAPELKTLPENLGVLKSLQKLILKGSNVKALPESVGQLASLRELTFTSDSLDKWSVLPATFSDLGSLQQLTIKAKGLETLPTNLGALKSLQRLILKGSNAKALPESVGQLSSLRELSFTCNSAEKWSMLPATFKDLGSLQQLTIEATGLETWPENLGALKSLQKLIVEGSNVKALPESVGQLSSLRELTFTSNSAQKWSMSPATFNDLGSLQQLTIKAEGLETLPKSFGALKSLQKLILEGSNVKALPESVGQLSSLCILRFTSGSAEKWSMLPTTFKDLGSLQQLRIEAEGLETLPENLGALKSLQELSLKGSNVKALPESVGQLSSLRELTFTSDSAEKLPESVWQLASLGVLALRVDSMSLSQKVGQLSSLRWLTFMSSAAKTLPQSLGQLDSLESLRLSCPNVEVLPNSLEQLSSLQSFTVDASNLVSLPEWLSNLPSLRRLHIRGGKFEYLPERLGHLSSLRYLYLEECKNLKSLPNNLGRWASKQNPTNTHNYNTSSNNMELYISKCPLLDDLVLSSLGWVKLVGCSTWNEYRKA